MRILVAEDDKVTTRIILKIIESLGHQAEAYADGDKAWAAYLENPARVVISDWVMPKMDGLALCQNIRKHKDSPYTYFILVSATRQSPDDFRNAVAHGVDDFLRKPLDPDIVWSRLYVAERILGFTKQIGEMGRLIPICAYCKKIRNDHDFWDQVESYIHQHTGDTFSHGICPECYQRIMKEEGLDQRIAPGARSADQPA